MALGQFTFSTIVSGKRFKKCETLKCYVDNELKKCDLCLVVGTSSVVYPAAMFAPQVAARGVPVAEFNLESTPETEKFGYHFEGPCGTTIPEALAE